MKHEEIVRAEVARSDARRLVPSPSPATIHNFSALKILGKEAIAQNLLL